MNTTTNILSASTKREAIVYIYIIISKQKNEVFPPLASPPFRLKKFCPELRKNALFISQSYESNFALYIIMRIM
jgi:hypothetical protein